jgi:hypothetical protein
MHTRCECRLSSGVELSISKVTILQAAAVGDLDFVLAAIERGESIDGVDGQFFTEGKCLLRTQNAMLTKID